MSALMKKNVVASGVSRRSTVVVQARRTVAKNKSSTPDSLVDALGSPSAAQRSRHTRQRRPSSA